jgi:GTP-sensing pleiotropic transcriptional regulator CodY
VFVVSKHIFDVSDANRKEEYFCVASKVINRTVTDIQIISCADRKLPVACIIEMEALCRLF